MVTEHDLLCMDKELTPTILAKNTTIAAYMLDLSSSTFKITMLLRWWLLFILYSWRGGLSLQYRRFKIPPMCWGVSKTRNCLFGNRVWFIHIKYACHSLITYDTPTPNLIFLMNLIWFRFSFGFMCINLFLYTY